MTPDGNADGAAADVLIRRLEFPIKAAAYQPRFDWIDLHLGQPDTAERDIQPLRRDQVVCLCWVEGGPFVRVEGELPVFSGTILQVGEGIVMVRPSGLLKLAMAGRSVGPDRMIRPEQYVAALATASSAS